MLKEIWKVIEDYPDYAISNFGRVKRIVTRKGLITEKYLKSWKDSRGYLQIGFRRNKMRTSTLISAITKMGTKQITVCPI